MKSPGKTSEYAIIRIGSNVSSVSECLELGKMLDEKILEAKNMIALIFGQDVFVSGSSLGILTARIEKINAAGGRLALVAPDPDFRSLLDVMKMAAILDVYASENEFLNSTEG